MLRVSYPFAAHVSHGSQVGVQLLLQVGGSPVSEFKTSLKFRKLAVLKAGSFEISKAEFKVLSKFGPRPLGPGQLGPGAQLSTLKKWQIGPQGPIVRGPTVRPEKVAKWATDSWGLQTNRTDDKSYGLWTNRTETNCTD